MNNPEKMLEQISLFCKDRNLQFMWYDHSNDPVRIKLITQEVCNLYKVNELQNLDEKTNIDFFLKKTYAEIDLIIECEHQDYPGLLLNIFKTSRNSFFDTFDLISDNKFVSFADYLSYINRVTKKELENDIKNGEFKESKILMHQMNFCFFIEMMPSLVFRFFCFNSFQTEDADHEKNKKSVQDILNIGFMDSLLLAFKKHEDLINRNVDLQLVIGKLVQNYIDVYPTYTNKLAEYFPFLKTLLLKDRSVDIVSQEESHQISYSIVIDRLKLQKNLVFNNVDSSQSQDIINHFKNSIDLKFKPYGLKNSILVNDNPVKCMLIVQFSEDAKITSKAIDLLLNSFIQNIVYSNLKGKELSEDKIDKIFNKTIMNLLIPEKMEINNKKLKL